MARGLWACNAPAGPGAHLLHVLRAGPDAKAAPSIHHSANR